MLANATNLVQNGSFETGNFMDWTLTGNTAFTGVCQNLSCPNPGGWPAEDGIYSAYFGEVGGSYTYLSQSIPTIAGQMYTLSFYLADPQGGTPNYFAVSFGTATFSITNFSAGFGWTLFQLSDMATGSTTDLKFTFRQDPNYWFLDNVAVNQGGQGTTPEPGTLALLGSGVLGLAGFARRKFLS